MQVKPRFETYKILEQYPLLKDDTRNEMCLTLLEVKLPSDKYEIIKTTYQFWVVIGKNKDIYANKAVAYSSVAFWKEKKKEKLFEGVVQGFTIKEEENGEHCIFDKESYLGNYSKTKTGLRTIFTISE